MYHTGASRYLELNREYSMENRSTMHCKSADNDGLFQIHSLLLSATSYEELPQSYHSIIFFSSFILLRLLSTRKHSDNLFGSNLMLSYLYKNVPLSAASGTANFELILLSDTHTLHSDNYFQLNCHYVRFSGR